MASSSTRRILASDIKPTPWKNGGGVTREIATGPAPCPGRDWGWRFSIADVAQDGPFSMFPDTDRVIAVIDGDGMDLIQPDGTATPLELFQAVEISGDDALFGRLRSGPVRDLNIMTRRNQFEATLDFRHGPHAVASELNDFDCLLIHSLNGRCAVLGGDGKPHELAAAETLVHEGQGAFEIRLTADARAAVIRIKRRVT